MSQSIAILQGTLLKKIVEYQWTSWT